MILEEVDSLLNDKELDADIQAYPAPSANLGAILIAEDDPRMQKVLQRIFTEERYAVISARDGHSALEMFRRERPVAVVLDLILPHISGRELCQKFKSLSSETSVVVLSAISEVADKVLLLELGADDYVTKPFSPRALMATVQAAIRRTQKTTPSNRVTFGNITADFSGMEVFKNGSPVVLTAHEIKLLKYFVDHAP